MTAEELSRVAGKHGIRLIMEFGSAASGHLHARSDHDLAIQLVNPEIGFDRYAEMAHDLQPLDPARQIDLTIINRADPLLLKKIFENCRLLYGQQRELAQLEIYAWKRFQDHRRYLALEKDYLERKIGPS